MDPNDRVITLSLINSGKPSKIPINLEKILYNSQKTKKHYTIRDVAYPPHLPFHLLNQQKFTAQT